MNRLRRTAWLRLNADTVFLGLLAFFSGLVAVVNPWGTDIIREIGRVTPVHIIQSTGLALGGLGVLAGLVWASIPIEVIGRAVLFGACVSSLWRHGLVYGWTESHTIPSYLLCLIVLATSVLRMSMFFSKTGFHFSIPARARAGDR